MKTFIATILLLSFMTVCYADNIKVPFECYPQEIVKLFNDNGLKLEKDASTRDRDSWGFLVNEGSNYTIVTYKPVTISELEFIREFLIWQKQP